MPQQQRAASRSLCFSSDGEESNRQVTYERARGRNCIRLGAVREVPRFYNRWGIFVTPQDPSGSEEDRHALEGEHVDWLVLQFQWRVLIHAGYKIELTHGFSEGVYEQGLLLPGEHRYFILDIQHVFMTTN